MRHRAGTRWSGVLAPTVARARLGAVVLLAAGAWSLYLAAAAPTPASAATLAATATITDPSLGPLASGGSATPFSVLLPANAACSGDTATDGYHVYSYLVEKGTDITGITFTTHPSTGFGLVNNVGVYYGPVNTAINTGEIVSIPTNFAWAPLLSDGATLSGLLYSGSTGVWEAGLACAKSSGVLSDYWNTEVTFTASSSDSSGFVWSAVPGVPGSPTTTTTTAGVTTTTAAATTTTTTTTTTVPAAATTTTTPAAGTTTTTSEGGSTATSSSGSSTSGSSAVGNTGAATSADSSSLPLTGSPVRRDVAVGMLCIGLGLILLGWSASRRARPGSSGAVVR